METIADLAASAYRSFDSSRAFSNVPSSFAKTAAFNTSGRHQLGRVWNILNMDGSY